MSSLLFGYAFGSIEILILAYGLGIFMRSVASQERREAGRLKKIAIVVLLFLKTAVPIGSIYCGIALLKMSGWILAVGAFLGMVSAILVIQFQRVYKRNGMLLR